MFGKRGCVMRAGLTSDRRAMSRRLEITSLLNIADFRSRNIRFAGTEYIISTRNGIYMLFRGEVKLTDRDVINTVLRDSHTSPL